MPKRSKRITIDRDESIIGETEREESLLTPAEVVVLHPAGFPLRTPGDDKPLRITTDNPLLFQAYATDQWRGQSVRKGDFLFDQETFPNFAFEVVDIVPDGACITSTTKVVLESLQRTTTNLRAKVAFDDIIGNEAAKEKCKIIQKYLASPQKFGDWAPRNILFYGPPGTGKTMTALALANESKVPISLSKATELIGTFVGEGAKRVHDLYAEASNVERSIVFIDELDAVGLDRKYQAIRGDVSEVVNALLAEMDGIKPNTGIVTVGATNAPMFLDSAIRSRFEEEIEFKLPTLDERIRMLRHYAVRLPLPVKANLERFASELDGASGRDIKEKFLKGALHAAMLRDANVIDDDLLGESLDKIRKHTSRAFPSQLFT
ncbi:MAG: AAA family ATPase [Promethearchaeati archaeon SRVP18_Atabeyarchaeia-1]